MRIFLILSCLGNCVFAQAFSNMDTLRLTEEQAHALMIKQNLQLLAAHYDVEISEAQLLQARAWSNPYLNWNQDLYSVENNEYLNFNNQFLVQIDQVFSIAGKYANTVRLAKLENEGNKLVFKDVIRALDFALGQFFQEAALLHEKHKVITQSVEHLTDLVQASELSMRLGAMSQREYMRLQSERLTLLTEQSELATQIFTVQAQFRQLLNLKPDVYILPLIPFVDLARPPFPLEDLLGVAQESRPDFLLSRNQMAVSDANLRLQRSLAVPDVTFSYQPKDRGSNYVRPYSGIEVGIEMPIFNRNEGNIAAARAHVLKSKAEAQLAETALHNEVSAAYLTCLESLKNVENYSEEFLVELKGLAFNSEISFRNKSIGLIDYIDTQRIYIQNTMDYLEARYSYHRSVHNLNFTVGKKVL
jgi:cobalt-zinc-cadmium efflux system outer membrane protein